MRASRIFALARTMRLAIAGGDARNARAISSVVSPQTARSVRACRASGWSAGWQHVKMSRSRSSSIGSSLPVCATASVSMRRESSSRDASARDLRRSTSTAVKRPAEMSHERGFAGRPSRGHCSIAAVKASCSASSARSKSPTRRMSVARTRLDSRR